MPYAQADLESVKRHVRLAFRVIAGQGPAIAKARTVNPAPAEAPLAHRARAA